MEIAMTVDPVAIRAVVMTASLTATVVTFLGLTHLPEMMEKVRHVSRGKMLAMALAQTGLNLLLILVLLAGAVHTSGS